jgi:hypothetical protein
MIFQERHQPHYYYYTSTQIAILHNPRGPIVSSTSIEVCRKHFFLESKPSHGLMSVHISKLDSSEKTGKMGND